MKKEHYTLVNMHFVTTDGHRFGTASFSFQGMASWAILGLNEDEMGLPGAPWPSAYCVGGLNFIFVSDSREGG